MEDLTLSQPLKNARDVAEFMLTRSGKALMSKDFERFADCFQFPNLVETIDGIETLKRREDLRAIYDQVHARFARLSIAQMERHILEASYRDEQTIVCTHETRLFSSGLLLQTPYPVFSILSRARSGKWLISAGTYGLMDSEDSRKVLTASVLSLNRVERN